MSNKLRVLQIVHVATKAVPFAKKEDSPGLAQVAGKIPSALVKLGIETSLILPLFKTTREEIERQGYELKDFATLEVKTGISIRTAHIKKADSPLDPSYPVYFVENTDLYGHDQMYDRPNDIERFSFLCWAALSLQRHLGVAPNVFDWHDWEASFGPFFIKWINTIEEPRLPLSDTFFKDTKSILTIHNFGFTGVSSLTSLSEVGLGLDVHLPAYAEFYGQFNPLKMGLYTADRSVVRSEDFIKKAIRDKHGPKDFYRIIRERLNDKRLAGIFPGDADWHPDRDLTDAVVDQWARRLLGVYRSVVEGPFENMGIAEQPSSLVIYRVSTPLEQLIEINPKAGEFYKKLNAEDQALIDQAIDIGETDRFKNVQSKSDLNNILSLLRIQPACDFEKTMEQEGLKEFLSPFFPGDLNRILSIKLDDFDGKSETTLYDIFANHVEHDRKNLLNHILNAFKTLKLIYSVAGMTDAELAKELEKRGALTGKESLANATTEFRHFCEVLGFISREENKGFYRAFIIGALLHDIGKPIDHDLHPKKGAKIFDKIKAIKSLLNDNEFDLTKALILYHSIFGDAIIIAEQNINDIKALYSISQDKKVRDITIKCLLLLGIADMSARGDKGLLSLPDIAPFKDAYTALLYSKDLNALIIALKLGKLAIGKKRWGNLAIRKGDSAEIEMRELEVKLAEEELAFYCRKEAGKNSKELMRQLSTNITKKMKKKIRHKIALKTDMKKKELLEQLGTMGHIWKINYILRYLDDARLRARLLIWLIEFSQAFHLKNICFEVPGKPKAEAEILIPLLEEFNIAEISKAIMPSCQYDSENDLFRIYIKNN